MIYQDIQITVNQGLAVPDKALYIFRGDSNIILNFKLVTPQYMLSKDNKDNLVMRFGVDNFELRLQLERGYDRVIRGVITEDGYCRTQLTGEVIQSLLSGVYTYQITLIDDDNNAVMTFPPCINKLNIRDRISTNARELAVPGGLSNEAMSDLSLIADNGEVLQAFDSNGNYIKTNWSAGDIISSAKLNKIEDAIDTINQNQIEVNSQLVHIMNKSYVSVTDFGAVGDANYYNDNDDKYYVDAKFTTLATDCTKAFKEALQVSTSIKLPKGNFWVTEPLNIPSKQLDFFGDGMSVSSIVFTGSNDLFTTTSSLLRVCFRDFSCIGTMATSGSCFNFPKSCTLHRSEFKNLILYSGDSCIYCGYDFSTLFENVHVWSRRGHGFDIQGRNSTVLLNCYAHQIDGVGKSGYRIYNYATLIGCNGLDSGETWGIFGGLASEDGANYYSYITLNGCNLEDFSSKALLIKNSGKVNIIGCKFDGSPESTYEHYIYAPNSNVEFTLIGNRDVSSNPASISHILSKHDYGNVFASGSDIKTVTSRTYNLTTIYDKSTGKTSCVLPSTGIIYRIGRTVVLEEGSASVGRVVDNNKIIGDELKIIVNCEGISLKNAVMGTNSDQSIITKDGTHRKLSKGEVIKLTFNGTNWIEI
jgi:hypothetical protein